MEPQQLFTFTHLHVHTSYSLLNSTILLDDLLFQCQKFGMNSFAITDHGNISGALDFYAKAIKAGVKPIIGCEIDVNARIIGNHNYNAKSDVFPLVLLAMNLTGYQNLIKLTSLTNPERIFKNPQIDYPLLEQYNDGLIVLTGGIDGEISSHIRSGSFKMAKSRSQYLRMIFGDRLYLELGDDGTKVQQTVNDGLIDLSKELDIPIVATSNCFYLTKEDAAAYEILRCIKARKKLVEKGAHHISNEELYFKSPKEMEAAFCKYPEAIIATQEIADRCNLRLDLGKSLYPVFPLPKGVHEEVVLKELAKKGLSERLQKSNKKHATLSQSNNVYQERLDRELSIITRMGYAGYFLIVYDFVKWAKKQGIRVGPGRGSGVASLVAYSLMITEIDPIKFNLLFERFLNPDRKSPPDLDVDFCQLRRSQVFDYISEKYGGLKHVAHPMILAFMRAKIVIRNVGYVLDVSPAVITAIVKNMPDDPHITLDKAIARSSKLRKIIMSCRENQKLFTFAQKLEGLPCHTVLHAIGIIISPVLLSDHLPIALGDNGRGVSRFDLASVKAAGFIKFDILGLKFLTVIDRMLLLLKDDLGFDFDLQTIPLDDHKTFELFQQGETTGIFQFGSCGMRKLLVALHPECFPDLVAALALYRPGPLSSGMKDQYLKARAGYRSRPAIVQLETILSETHGVILFQEQVMKIAIEIASYSLGDADLLCRAMTSKNLKMMASEKEKFIAGATHNRIKQEHAAALFAQMAEFAKYAFNKSHSTAYALLAYQNAYLKVHFPIQYMAALSSCDDRGKLKF